MRSPRLGAHVCGFTIPLCRPEDQSRSLRAGSHPSPELASPQGYACGAFGESRRLSRPRVRRLPRRLPRDRLQSPEIQEYVRQGYRPIVRHAFAPGTSMREFAMTILCDKVRAKGCHLENWAWLANVCNPGRRVARPWLLVWILNAPVQFAKLRVEFQEWRSPRCESFRPWSSSLPS